MIFKNKRYNNSNAVLPLLEKNYFIVESIKEGKTLKEMADERMTKTSNIQWAFKAICKELEREYPFIEKLYNFNTYLELNKIIKPDWVPFIGRMIVLRNKHSFISTINPNFIVNKKLYHRKVVKYKKGEPYETIASDFITLLEKRKPITVKDFADELELNHEDVLYVFQTLFFEKIVIMDDYILSTRKSTIKAMILFMETEKSKYSLQELYEKFSVKYPLNFKYMKIATFEEFSKYVVNHSDLFKKVTYKKDDGSYEVIGF